jgi:hypothetical protein
MPYETTLNVPVQISSVNSSTVTSAGYAATLKLAISGTTLGDKYPDEVCTLTLRLSANSDGVSLSASETSSILLSLSSPTVLPTPQVWPGVVASSTFRPSTSATVTITFPQVRSLLTTNISLSAGTSTVVDPVGPNALDNFFYLTGSPDSNYQVRTTGGHSSLQSYLG